MNTPDITAAQIVAIIQACVAFIVAFGAPLTTVQQEAIIQLATVLAAALPLSDAAIRRGRARVAEAVIRADRDA